MWVYFTCDKTFNFENFCPYCYANKQLWLGSESDKKAAKAFSRKEKYASNFYIVDDPRDKDVPKDIENRNDKLNSGKTKIYEFGQKVESKLRAEILDEKEGLGYSIFDPGEDGYNLIIKVKSTKPDINGKVWPDYSDSKFSKSSSAIGSDREIRTILDSTQDLNEYIQAQRKSPAEMKDNLEKDMLWGLVKSEWERNYGTTKAVTEEEEISRPPISDVIEDEDSNFDPDDVEDDLDKTLANL
jgi:hypothetical protein